MRAGWKLPNINTTHRASWKPTTKITIMQPTSTMQAPTPWRGSVAITFLPTIRLPVLAPTSLLLTIRLRIRKMLSPMLSVATLIFPTRPDIWLSFSCWFVTYLLVWRGNRGGTGGRALIFRTETQWYLRVGLGRIIFPQAWDWLVTLLGIEALRLELLLSSLEGRVFLVPRKEYSFILQSNPLLFLPTNGPVLCCRIELRRIEHRVLWFDLLGIEAPCLPVSSIEYRNTENSIHPCGLGVGVCGFLVFLSLFASRKINLSTLLYYPLSALV